MFGANESRFSGYLRRRGPGWKSTPWVPVDSRASKQKALLQLLSLAHEQRLDAAALIDNFATEQRGLFRWQLYRLAARLRSGTPLVSALEQTPDVLSESDALAIRFGTQSGTLAATYQSLLERPSDSSSRTRTQLQELVAYLCFMLIPMILLINFLFLFIVPTLVSLEDEFGSILDRPAPLQLLHNMYNHPGLGSLLLLLVVFAFIGLAFRPVRRLFTRSAAAQWLSPFSQLRAAELLHMLSVATAAGRPLSASLSTLARYHFDRSTRAKLLYARNEVEQGTDIWTSLADAKLLSSAESHALSVSTSNRSRAWAMRRLADWKRQRLFQRMETLMTILRPLMLLVFATVVLLLCCAMFQFLTNLIFSLTS